MAVLDYDPRSRTAVLGAPPEPAGEPSVAVVTAGTSDLPVAREAIRTLAFYGVAAREIADVGSPALAHPPHEEELRRYPVVIVSPAWKRPVQLVAGLSRVVIACRLDATARARRETASSGARQLRPGGHGQHRQRYAPRAPRCALAGTSPRNSAST